MALIATMSRKLYDKRDIERSGMHTKGYTEGIIARIENAPAGKAFVPTDFSDITDAQTIRRLLKRFTDEGKITRVLQGVFYRPKTNRLLGEAVPPDPDSVAHAIARAQNWTITPSGQTALNALGLSTQVPAVWTYVSDGSYRSYSLDGYKISFKRSTNKNVTGMSPDTLLVVQALKALGKDRVTEGAIRTISRRFSPDEKRIMMDETERATAWIRETIRAICSEGESG